MLSTNRIALAVGLLLAAFAAVTTLSSGSNGKVATTFAGTVAHESVSAHSFTVQREGAVEVTLTALRPGSIVLAFGHPLGVSNALSLGIVHDVTTDDSGEARWIRIDVRLAPGNSGGPLADAHGRVIGINTLVAGGLGHALPLSVVSRFLRWAGLWTPGRRAA